MVKHDVIKKTFTYTYSELKQFFDMLNQFVLAEGSSLAFSYAMVKNILILDDIYKAIISGIYLPEKDSKVAEYQDSLKALAEKYADRDQYNEIKYDSANHPIVFAQQEEYKKALAELEEQNKDLIERVKNAETNNRDYLVKNTQDVEICTLPNIEACPDTVPPILLYYMFKDQF